MLSKATKPTAQAVTNTHTHTAHTHTHTHTQHTLLHGWPATAEEPGTGSMEQSAAVPACGDGRGSAVQIAEVGGDPGASVSVSQNGIFPHPRPQRLPFHLPPAPTRPFLAATSVFAADANFFSFVGHPLPRTTLPPEDSLLSDFSLFSVSICIRVK